MGKIKQKFYAFPVLLCLAVVMLSCKPNYVVNKIQTLSPPNDVSQVSVEVKNKGSKDANSNSLTKLEAKNNQSAPYEEVVKLPVPALSKGQSFSSPWVLDKKYLGEDKCIYLKACADVTNTVAESSEADNCTSGSTQTFCPSCGLCCTEKLPSSFDWRNNGGVNYMTPVKNQAQCGSCWAFSAVGAVEGRHNIETPAAQINNVDLSEQNLVTCGNAGSCLGGSASGALNYIRNTGIVEEQTFPYQSQNCVFSQNNQLQCQNACITATGSCTNPATCNWATPTDTWRISGWRWVPNNIDDIKRSLLCSGPLSVCSADWWHCIVLTGWDDNALVNNVAGAWIIKNSWGAGWNNGGYGNVSYTGVHSDIKNSVIAVENVTQQ